MSDAFSAVVALGTGRLSAPPPPPHPVVEAAWQGLDWSKPERAMLHGAALVAAARAAGRLPVVGATTATLCDADPKPSLPEPAALALRSILAGTAPDCLRELVGLAVRGGWRCSHRDVPALLDRALRDAALRDDVLALAGVRGAWLARLDARWQVLLGHAPVAADAFATGTAEERVAWLRQIHTSDPAAAAAALAAGWKQESGEMRERLLAVIAASPSTADEPLLAMALGDRRRELRRLARAGLRRLPASGFVERARARLPRLVTCAGRLLGRRLVLDLPSAFDPEWQRDGVEASAPAGMGEKAFWALQLLTAVPLASWPEVLGRKPDDLFALNRDEESRDLLLRAWSETAAECEDPSVVAAFVTHAVSRADWPAPAGDRAAVIASALRAATAAAASFFAAAAVWREESEALPLAVQVLLQFSGELSEAAGDQVAARLLDRWRAGRSVPAAAAPQLALQVPARSCPAVVRALAELPELTADAERFARVLEFRSSYLVALTGPAQP